MRKKECWMRPCGFQHAVDCRGKEANEDLQDTCVGPKSPKHKTHTYINIK